MGTRLDRPAVAVPGRAARPSARRLAERAARAAMAAAGVHPCEVDLLLNAGLYHDRNLGEPALAALIQHDLEINPDDPHAGGCGSFSFDIANGTCGPLTALQVADGLLRAGTIERALVVASDADPGRRLAASFPFSAAGAAVLCEWSEGAGGIAGFHWEHAPREGALLRARVGFERGHNRLHIEQHAEFGATAAAWAAKAASALLADAGLRSSDIDLVVANPLTEPFLEGLAEHLGVDRARLVTVERAAAVHTAGLLVALAAAGESGRLEACERILLVSAGAGITAGAALVLP